MSIVPPSAVGSLAAPAPSSVGTAPDGDLAGVFAALIDSLQAQLTGGEAGAMSEPTADGEETAGSGHADADGVDGGPDADAGAFALPAGAAIVPGWPTPASADPALESDGDALSGVTSDAAPALGADAGVVLDEAALLAEAGLDQTGQIDRVGGGPVDAGTPLPLLAEEAATVEPSTGPTDASADTLEAGVDDLPAAPAADEAAPDVELLADAAVPSTVTAGPFAADEGAASVGPATGLTAGAPASARTDVPATVVRPQAPALPDQLVEVIAPLRRGVDGSHRVSIQLRPDELGEVRVEMHVRGNEISLSLRADLPGTSDLLRQSLAELRAQLEAAGFRSGALDVGSHADPRSAHDGDTQRSGATPGGVAATSPTEQPPIPIGAGPTAGIDLRI